MTLRINIWSDIVCPWCYVGKARLDAALERFAHRDRVEITWHSFELDPSAPRAYEGDGTYATRLARKYGTSVPRAQQMIDQMTHTAAADGLTFDFSIARPGNTFDAHRLSHWAHELGRQHDLEERLFRATFTEGQPIADPDTLAKLAAEVGLDEEQARAVLASEQFASDVRADEHNARELGISGVPFFVFGGKYAVSGAQPADVLLQVLERTWAEQAAPEVVAAGPGCDGDVCG